MTKRGKVVRVWIPVADYRSLQNPLLIAMKVDVLTMGMYVTKRFGKAIEVEIRPIPKTTSRSSRKEGRV